MKILHVNNYSRIYGTEKYIHDIMEYLTRRGHRNELFVQKWSQGNNPVTAAWNTRQNILQLDALIRRFAPNIIHIHNIINYRLLDYLLHHAPCLKTMHEFRPFCLAVQMRKDTGRLCFKHLSRECFTAGCVSYHPRSLYRFYADRRAMLKLMEFPYIWVMSRYMADLMRGVMPPESTIVSHPVFYHPRETIPPDPPGDPNVFAVGRLAPEKGFDRFLKVLSLLKTPATVKLAGDGPEKNRLQRMASDLNLNVEFLGYVPNEDLEAFYHWSRVVVFPSIYPEPFGIVGLEAMGAARPVVAFDVGGVEEWLEHARNGFRVPWDDHPAFASQLDRLLTDRDLCISMGRAGRDMLLSRFTVQEHIDKLEATYHAVVNAYPSNLHRG